MIGAKSDVASPLHARAASGLSSLRATAAWKGQVASFSLGLPTWALVLLSSWRQCLISFVFSPAYPKEQVLVPSRASTRKGYKTCANRYVLTANSSSNDSSGPRLRISYQDEGHPARCHRRTRNGTSIPSTFRGWLAVARSAEISLECDSCDLLQVNFLARRWRFRKLRFTPSACG